jgi:hypothetical protein
MNEDSSPPATHRRRLVFPPWFDRFVKLLLVVIAGGPVYVILLAAYAGSAENTETGYMPTQPVEYSHELHAGQLGMDCRYCHTGVEVGRHAAIPPTQTCMNCHTGILPESEELALVKESHRTGLPVRWIRVHDLPGFTYFDHSAHVRRGVGCLSCHGRIDKMEVVYQEDPLTMGWCLDCHREPEPHLRPLDKITDMEWSLPEEEQLPLGRRLREELDIDPSTNCSACHR